MAYKRHGISNQMNPKRYNQIERVLQILDKSRVPELLKGDRQLLFLFAKSERIVAACYVLTGMYSNDEPLKWRLRDTGMELISCVLSFRGKNLTQMQGLKEPFFTILARMFSFFDLAHAAHLISPMNLSVIKKEIEGLRQIAENIERTMAGIISSNVIGEDFFGISRHFFDTRIVPDSGKTDVKETGSAAKDADMRQRIYSFDEFERNERMHQPISQGQKLIKDTVLYNKKSLSFPIKDTNKTHDFVEKPISSQLNENRKRLILDVIKRNGSAMIKDFSEVIIGCSEKTIQRRLSDLVASGVLKKVGERRWSKYYMS